MFRFLIKAENEAVQNLKTLLTNPLVLTQPHMTSLYMVNIDTCDSQVGCVLL